MPVVVTGNSSWSRNCKGTKYSPVSDEYVATFHKNNTCEVCKHFGNHSHNWELHLNGMFWLHYLIHASLSSCNPTPNFLDWGSLFSRVWLYYHFRFQCNSATSSCMASCAEESECSVYQLCGEGGYCESPGGSECVTHDDCKIPRLYFCNPYANHTCTPIDKTGSPCHKQLCGELYYESPEDLIIFPHTDLLLFPHSYMKIKFVRLFLFPFLLQQWANKFKLVSHCITNSRVVFPSSMST